MSKMKRLKFKFQSIKNAMDEILNEDKDTKGMRVAERAVMQAQMSSEDFLKRLVKQAAILAKHTKRKTIKREDLLLALDMLRTKGQV